MTMRFLVYMVTVLGGALLALGAYLMLTGSTLPWWLLLVVGTANATVAACEMQRDTL